MDSASRRDFMKVFGISMASLILTRCGRFTPPITCYAPMPPPTVTPTSLPSSALERLRLLWLRFGELAEVTLANQNTDDELGDQLITDHRLVLDELVAQGQVSAPVADLVQEAYAAAVYHVWRSNAPITCYAPAMVDYAPASAGVLVRQSELLSEVAAQGIVNAETLSKAQAAIERDMAFYELSDDEIQTLYGRLMEQAQEKGGALPAFEALPLEPTSDARTAARFIVNLLTGK